MQICPFFFWLPDLLQRPMIKSSCGGRYALLQEMSLLEQFHFEIALADAGADTRS